MKFFGKNKDKNLGPEGLKSRGDEKIGVTPEEFADVGTAQEKSPKTTSTTLPKEFGILKGFYVSEKSSSLSPMNQYVFKTFSKTTKSEVKKQVEKSFNVKVKGIKIINLPGKKRLIGRHVGFRAGLKKAIVVLEEGYSIEGFQP